ncbi:MAG: sugar phosphate nucleotidyltransferase [Patescibacteria group bacterium]
MTITKAIIPVAGMGTRFLPLSKAVPKELWPLVDKPVIQYIVEEAKASGIKEIMFITKGERDVVLDYFKRNQKIEDLLKERKKDRLLAELEKLSELCEGLSFSHVPQKKPLGDGHAILQAQKWVGNDPVAVMWADDVVESLEPCLSQLSKIFETCQKPVIALYRLPAEQLPFYGVADVEKIANRLFKLKKVIEKPALNEAPSDLAVVGKYILTPEVFAYLKKAKPSSRGEIILADVLDKMLIEGKLIYGYEFKGKWLECGNKAAWLKSSFYLARKHPEFGPGLKDI